MGLKSPIAKGKRRQELLRNGRPLVPAGWRGMLLEGDAGMLPLDRPRHIENFRWVGGNLRHRGLLVPVDSPVLDSATTHVKDLYDFQTNKPRRVYLVYSCCPDIAGSTGKTIAWLDFDQYPTLQRGKYYPSVAAALSIGIFDGKMMLGLDSALKSLTTIVTPYGTESLSITGGAQERPLDTYTGFIIRAICEFDGRAFLGLDAGAGASRIGTWDGITSRYGLTASAPADLSGIDAPTTFCRWRDLLVVGFGLATNHIRTRVPGDTSPGTWTTVPPAAGNIASRKMESYKDILYIADGGENVWSYDGTTLQKARTIVGATINGIVEFNGYLHYAYMSAAAHAIIGRFDGTTWTDALNDLTVTTSAALKLPQTIVSYRGCLVILVETIGLGLVYMSQNQITTGAYTKLDPGDLAFSTGSTEVRDAVVM